MKDSIVKISWKKEGFFEGGHFLFNTKQGDFQIDTRPTVWNTSVVHTTNQIIGSLLALAPDRFYNEKTGVLIQKEVLEKIRTDRKFRKYARVLPKVSIFCSTFAAAFMIGHPMVARAVNGNMKA